ncbi:DUF262 domain-containing protein [Modicisalibacter xianhensis]|uniref:Uncharacterized conserved protein, contains ParB-like and HNH nuclease domains n=1 Tax=Modicisalibacter xianhensis TaxID=442341 RepID=A0A1I2ZNC0_9GAMM|nr:DUF262 domain-containing protein [Halomonas xianhensis]SFH38581.1 Uncharacterized conserved protein, contains ParB-like and HNH nuclease domains [Halomonas xianhensis]
MKELIFSLDEIFDRETTAGCLSQYTANFFHIPAYQRGYKWSSEKGGAVTILLDDLKSAFQNKEEEYYLQYITVKRRPLVVGDQEIDCLEVIDGQQRLTTLSVLLSVFSALLGNSNLNKNIAAGKLHYAVRSNFFEESIYPSDKVLHLAETSWEDLVTIRPELDKQDIYLLHGAVKACYLLICEIEERVEFYRYILSSVKLIVNSVERHISSETVFRNLNSNKVPLTETELIKGLLLTQAGRKRVHNADSHFKEVLEVRLGLGKDWENIQRWTRQAQVRNFYFGSASDGMHQLLKLTAMGLAKLTKSKLSLSSQKYPLFEFYSQLNDADQVLTQLIDIQQRLADWFDNDYFYHAIGFCRFAKSSPYITLPFLRACLDKPSRADLKAWLGDCVRSLIGIEEGNLNEVEKLMYGEDDNRIHAVLLSLSIYPDSKYRGRFNFEAFNKEEWSLEHIFPQSPEGKGQVLKESHKENIRQLLQDASEEKEISEQVEEVLQLPQRSTEQRDVYEKALEATGCINNIGNICLLAKGDNSALGNKFFVDKRVAILQRIQAGSFVPKHTFDVFAKMITGLDDDIEQWTAHDISSHSKHVSSSLHAALMRGDL